MKKHNKFILGVALAIISASLAYFTRNVGEYPNAFQVWKITASALMGIASLFCIVSSLE